MVQSAREAERVVRENEKREGASSMEPCFSLRMAGWRRQRVGGGLGRRACATLLLVGSLALALGASVPCAGADYATRMRNRRPFYDVTLGKVLLVPDETTSSSRC